MFFDVFSAYRGIRVMNVINHAKWHIRFMPRRFWMHLWTPVWHDGNGPYLSCGIYVMAIYRGY